MILVPRCSCSGSLDCEKRNTLRGAQNYNIGLEGAPTPGLRFCKTYFVFRVNVTYDSLSSMYCHGVRLVALWKV